MGILEELGKAALQGVAKGIEQHQKQQALQQQQAELQHFAANEQSIKNAATNGNLEAIQYLAIMYYKQGDYQNSVYWARKGASVDDATCLYLLGDVALNNGDYASSEKFLKRNVSVNGDILSATLLGNMYINAKDLNSARYYFDFVLRRDNSNADAAFGLVSCMTEEENPNLDEMEQLLQISARSNNMEIRDGSRQLLQQIRELKAERANQNNCFITTAVCGSFGKPDDCFELTAFRKFRDDWLNAQPDGKALIAEYYAIAPRIVANINRLADAKEIYKHIWQKYLAPCLNFIERGDNDSCKSKYVEIVCELKKQYS